MKFEKRTKTVELFSKPEAPRLQFFVWRANNRYQEPDAIIKTKAEG
jgi:hypothetical protein